MSRRRRYDPEEIMQRLKITGLPRADFSPYDSAGWEYIVDLPNGQAFRLAIEPCAGIEEEYAS
jgi:hypothetical protein